MFHLPILPTQLLDRRFRTALSIKEIAGDNNSTRVLKRPLSGCQYLRPSYRMGISNIASRAMDDRSLELHGMAESNAAITSAGSAEAGSFSCDGQPVWQPRMR